MCAFGSDSKFHSVPEGKKPAEGDKNVGNRVETLDLLELCNELEITIDLPEDNEKAHSYSDNDPNKKSKKRKSLVESQSVLEGASNEKVFICATDNEPSASNARTVQLVLFGSSAKNKCVLMGSRKSRVISAEAVSAAVQNPPMLLTIKLSPMKRKSESETASARKHSDKRRLCEKSRISFPPTKMKHRHKLKTQKCTLATSSGPSLKKAEKVDPANTEELPVSSETRILSGTTRPCLSLKKRRSHSKECVGEKTKRRTATLSQPADQEKSEEENESSAVMPLLKNDVLKFGVLPKAFDFKDGSNGRKENEYPLPGNSDLVEEKDESPSKTIKRARGTWYQNPEEKNMLIPPTPKTDNVFIEFQKKYKDKMQPSVDK
ncbi:hypothetical protein KUDE01_028740 [Dissostichus eleginoides]|uniref:Uncharacterized protein n=1 Tax=Dissostichus eleginoides TaxID=100907 RepID=A0AAD9BS20_DISEL|nr:hypothetical protein KUDE01_028740 [Dissostichus eleginoides]